MCVCVCVRAGPGSVCFVFAEREWEREEIPARLFSLSPMYLGVITLSSFNFLKIK